MSQCKRNRAAYYGLLSSMNRCGWGCHRGCGYSCCCGWYPGYNAENILEPSDMERAQEEPREEAEPSNEEEQINASGNVSFLYGEQLERSEPYDDGETIVIREIHTTGRDIDYDPEEGVVTVNRRGVYFIQWNLLARHRNGKENDVVIALENPEGGYVYARSGAACAVGAQAASVTGAAAVRLEKGQRLMLVNRSGASVSLYRAGDAHGFSASMVMYPVSG